MSTAAIPVPAAPGQLDLFRLRDDLAQTYNPANAHERMLVSEIAQSWIRLERAHELEKRYFEGQDMFEIIRTRLAEFKAVTRYVTDCERAWRHATLNLGKSQRQRKRTVLAAPTARRAVDRPAPPVPPQSAPAAKPADPSVAAVPSPRRE